jgi:hypothetical protein
VIRRARQSVGPRCTAAPGRKQRTGFELGECRFFCRSFYQIATAGIAQTAREAMIYKDARFSDHTPLTIQYDVHP